MIAIQRLPAENAQKFTSNILPCRIHHNGPIDVSRRHWKVEKAAGTRNTSYFRGRKLEGRSVKVPDGYTGVVLSKTDKILPQKPSAPKPPPGYDDGDDGDMEEDDREDEAPNVRIAEETGTFEEIVVWSHETAPPGDDPYIKGIEEWIALAQTIHAVPSEGAK